MFIRFLCARVDIGNLKVDAKLAALVKDEIAPGLNVDANAFWTKFGQIVNDLGPKNQALLKKRDDIQKAIDEWHLANKVQWQKPPCPVEKSSRGISPHPAFCSRHTSHS